MHVKSGVMLAFMRLPNTPPLRKLSFSGRICDQNVGTQRIYLSRREWESRYRERHVFGDNAWPTFQSFTFVFRCFHVHTEVDSDGVQKSSSSAFIPH